jgi:hypothetical protein
MAAIASRLFTKPGRESRSGDTICRGIIEVATQSIAQAPAHNQES